MYFFFFHRLMMSQHTIVEDSKIVTPIRPAHSSTQLLPFCREHRRNKFCYPGNPSLRPSPCIRHMGLEEMGIELAMGRSVFWTMIHWTIWTFDVDALLLGLTAGLSKRWDQYRSKSLGNDIANFSVFEWSAPSVGFFELVPLLDSEVRGFSMSLISTRL